MSAALDAKVRRALYADDDAAALALMRGVHWGELSAAVDRVLAERRQAATQ